MSIPRSLTGPVRIIRQLVTGNAGLQSAEMVAAAGLAIAMIVAFFGLITAGSAGVLNNLGDSVPGADMGTAETLNPLGAASAAGESASTPDAINLGGSLDDIDVP